MEQKNYSELNELALYTELINLNVHCNENIIVEYIRRARDRYIKDAKELIGEDTSNRDLFYWLDNKITMHFLFSLYENAATKNKMILSLQHVLMAAILEYMMF